MQTTILLPHNDDIEKTEEEFKYRCLKSILDGLEINTGNLFVDKFSLTIDEKIALKALLQQNQIFVENYPRDEMKVYLLNNIEENGVVKKENVVIGHFKKCRYTLKRDPLEIDPSKRIYLELTLDFTTIFDD
jgi:hypothetical protein